MKLKLVQILICSIMCWTSSSLAQNVNHTQRTFKRNAATVIFASLGGGILGLSTLSFYGQPQEHTNNITMGVGAGLIAGLVYVFLNEEETQREVKSPWIPETNFTRVAQQTVIPKSQIIFKLNYTLS